MAERMDPGNPKHESWKAGGGLDWLYAYNVVESVSCCPKLLNITLLTLTSRRKSWIRYLVQKGDGIKLLTFEQFYIISGATTCFNGTYKHHLATGEDDMINPKSTPYLLC